MMYQLLTLLLLISFIPEHSSTPTTSSNTNNSAIEDHCAWSPCNVPGFPSSFNGYSIDCCVLKVPLNYANPDRKISISMSRLKPSLANAQSSSLFILNGGPGGSGWGLFYQVMTAIPAATGLILVLPDHRGTGLSALLSCDDQGSQKLDTACIKYLLSKWGRDGLNQFSITSAAHDLASQIKSYKIDHFGKIGILGVSYGTLWLDRFLQIYPALVDRAAMDSVVNPITSSESRADLLISGVGWQFLQNCQMQVECNKHFPADQSAPIMLHQILKELKSNKQYCARKYLSAYKLTPTKLRKLFLGLMKSGENYMDRTVIPAVIYRLNRCNAKDAAVLKFFFNATASLIGQQTPGFIHSQVLSYNIMYSEMWLAVNETEIDEKTYKHWYESTIIAPEHPSNYLSLRAKWPKYPIDQYYGRYASSSPVLMLSGQMDPATVFDQASHLATLTAKTRKFYAIPLAPHVTINIGVAGYSCPMRIIMSYLFPNLIPAEFGDPKCIEELPTTIDFAGETQLGRTTSLKFLNVNKPFGE